MGRSCRQRLISDRSVVQRTRSPNGGIADSGVGKAMSLSMPLSLVDCVGGGGGEDGGGGGGCDGFFFGRGLARG